MSPAVTLVTAVTPVTAVTLATPVLCNAAVTERASLLAAGRGVPTLSLGYYRYFGNRSNLHTPGNRLVGRAARPWPRWPTLVVDPKFHP
jgi:hypothetical protein